MAYTTIKKPSDYFNTVLYTGNGSARTITTGMQPDLNWIKRRNQLDNHWWTDSVRGATKYIGSNRDNAEATETTAVTGITSTGFTLGDDSNQGEVNANTYTYASWNWKAGTSFTNDASATGIGSIDSTGSFNTTSGFSIVSYTGTGSAGTIKHGLSSTPKMIIVKRISGAVQDWVVYHASVGNNKALFLNAINAPDTDIAYFNDTSPTSSVFSVKSGGTNNNGDNCIAYCFADVQGFSKFGSYVGNGSTDGPFIYTGFKPSFVMTKNSSGANNWTMCDNKRNTFNPANSVLNPNVNTAEAINNPQDFVSNGFKNRATESNTNNTGSTYIYMAFAEEPLVGDNPATAR